MKRSEYDRFFMVNPVNPVIEILVLFDRPPVPANPGGIQEHSTNIPSAPLTRQILSPPVAYDTV